MKRRKKLNMHKDLHCYLQRLEEKRFLLGLSFFTYIFSQSKLTLFSKYEVEKENSWNNRDLIENNQWAKETCDLKNGAYRNHGQCIV